MAELRCIDCKTVVRFDPAYWLGKGLNPPKRCRHCRDARRAGKSAPGQSDRGTVAYLCDDERGVWGFIRTFLDARFYFAAHDLATSNTRPLVVGDKVAFEIDPEADRPRARLVRRIE